MNSFESSEAKDETRFVLRTMATTSSAPGDGAVDEAAKRKRGTKRVDRGNYSGYYGFRFGEAETDPRVDVLQEAWLDGKRVLDVGCNVGKVTLRVAEKCNARWVMGIDVDGKLIQKARKNLWEARKSCKKARLETDETDVKPLQEVSFSAQDIDDLELSDGVDTILCLSVIKWIQLKKGDEGVKRTFRKFESWLPSGGMLILEPQPWLSYRQAFRKGQVDSTKLVPLDQLTFRPKDFVAHLTQVLSFRLVREIRDQGQGKKSFARPIYVFQKQ